MVSTTQSSTHVSTTDMAAQDRSQEQFDVFVRFPSGSTGPVAVRYDMTIFELKAMIEFAFGVPVEMQKLSYKHRLLQHDDETLRTCIIIPGVRINVAYLYGWEELIEASLAGDTKSVINDIYHHFDKSIIARRRFIAVFISSHKGYGFLVERMLSDAVNTNAQTSSGRTALHIAGAMGMMNCVRLLLQHHASVDIQDKFGFTPQELAKRCGQTEVEAKLIQFRRIKNKWDEKTIKRQLPWPLSNNYPQTKLGQSVSPIIDLQRLCITPGPEEIRVYPLPGQRPSSAVVRSAKVHSPRSETESIEDIRKQGKFEIHKKNKRLKLRPISAPTVTFSDMRNENCSEEMIALPVVTSHAIPVPSVMEEIDFSKHKIVENSDINVDSDGGVPLQAWDCNDTITEFKRPNIYDSNIYSYKLPNNLVSVQKCGTTASNSLFHQELSPNNGSPNGAELPYDTYETVLDYEVSQTYKSPRDNASRVTSESIIDPWCTNEHCQEPMPVPCPNERPTSCLPRPIPTKSNLTSSLIRECLEYETEDEKRIREAVAPKFISEKERFQIKYGKKRATDEENERSFQQWLALKQQDAKDEKLIRRVKKMLDTVRGVKVEEKTEPSKDESNVSAGEKAFQAWLTKKKEAEITRRRQEIQREKECEKHKFVRLGKTFDEWVKEKDVAKLSVRETMKCEDNKRTNNTQRTKSQQVYNSWLKKKQEEEIERLQSNRSKRPYSAVGVTKYKDDGPIRRTRIQSSKPRLKTR